MNLSYFKFAQLQWEKNEGGREGWFSQFKSTETCLKMK